MTMKKKVFLIDDDTSSLRATLSIIVESSSRLRVVGEYNNGEDGIKDIPKKSPEIIVMSIDLPGKNGIEVTQLIKLQYPHIEVLLVSGYEDVETVLAGLKAGASGYILRSENFVNMLGAIEEVSFGGAPMSRKIARMVVNVLHINLNSVISKRERQVIQMMSTGMTYSEISEALFS